jgi:hypothetical protein
MQNAELRETLWASPKETLPPLPTIEEPVEEYGQMARGPQHSDELLGAVCADAFAMQEDGKLRCEAGRKPVVERSPSRECLYESVPSSLPYQTDCQHCSLREQCLASGAKGDRARRGSSVRRLLPPPPVVECERKPVLLGPMLIS